MLGYHSEPRDEAVLDALVHRFFLQVLSDKDSGGGLRVVASGGLAHFTQIVPAEFFCDSMYRVEEGH